MRKIGIIGVPSSAGARRTGQELAPQSFRRAGLIEKLISAGLQVSDYGDLPEFTFQHDRLHPKAQNLQQVVEVAGLVAEKVKTALLDNTIPLVLGGDCTITLGVLSGLLNYGLNPGLMYFDGDLDLNTPETTPSGIFDGMVIAHIIGKGDETLARSGPRYPLMVEENIVMFAYNTEAGSIDAVEDELLQQSKILKYPLHKIRGRAGESAKEALDLLEDSVDSILVHFDVDVINFDDFPAGDVPHYHGLSFNETMSAINFFVTSRKFAGLVITEFNTHRDPDGTLANQLVESVAKALK